MVSCLQSCLWSAMDACTRCCGCPQETAVRRMHVNERETTSQAIPEYTLSDDGTRLTILDTKETNAILKYFCNNKTKYKSIRLIRFENADIDLETIRLITDFSPAEGYSTRGCLITRNAALVQERPELDEG